MRGAAALAGGAAILALFAFAAPASAQLSLPDLQALLAPTPESPAPASASVDLLAEATSYVPPFYRGRALPSPASSVRLEAIPHLRLADGSSIASGRIVYTWKEDGTVVGSASGLGKATAILPGPPLFGSATYSVEASTQDGAGNAQASVTVASEDPQITLYEDHPLYGIEYYNAVPSSASIPDTEMTFAGVPYFAAEALSNPNLSWAWKINGLPVATSSSANELTINASDSSGAALLSVSLTSLSDLALEARGLWQLTFAGQGSAGAPAASPAQDAFHRTQ